MPGKHAQIISAIQQKGGACKSTLIQCLGARIAKDGAKVLIIDTDPQASCVDWASEQDIANVDILAHLDEDSLFDIIEKVRPKYDAILIDTAGYDSAMAGYTIQISDLILIPSGGSKSSVKGAAKTWRHVSKYTINHKNPPEVRLVMWGIKSNTNVFQLAKETIKGAKIPVVPCHVGSLIGFEAMSWNGGLPTGTAAMALSQFLATLQTEDLVKFYNDNTEIKDGKAA